MKEHVKIFKQKINKARNLSIKIEQAEREVFKFLEALDIDYDEEIIKNSITIAEVISTYISYGDIECMDELIKLLDNIE